MSNKQLALILIPLFVVVFWVSFFIMKAKTNNDENNDISKNNDKEVLVVVNNKELTIKLDDNSSSKEFYNKLLSENVTVEASDYGNFEKVGELGFSLVTNDKLITTKPGDLILYEGNKISLYYDVNTYTFTKLGEVKNISEKELKELLGEGNVILQFKLK